MFTNLKINKTLSVTLAGVVSAAVILLTGDLTAQQRPAGPFTAAQVATGKAAYEKNCASCHLPTLAGSGDASALAGTPFMSNWGARNVGALHSFIQTSMPPTAANSLGEATYLAITSRRITTLRSVRSGMDSPLARSRRRVAAKVAARRHRLLRTTARVAVWSRRRPRV